ncbi:DUF7878 domain-containing protein [Alkalihalobacterium chitinilyticum]|uniref:DUF7878 domain-containing protein n=1 Tax=Alkalihalobacterium chitinilyticum TaxID=2980103 RepID=A0ABT5VFQ8_9BACI|nr:hypothetical protein [Alkalihalobacterium chitinilyticum]MDE5414264.1 hypothetical protein [Alkalihalobacterium chitinilyticum]
MNRLSKIDFKYEFISNKGVISNKLRKDVPSILAVEALVVIRINNEIYFQAELAILEFYKSLFKWKEKVTKDHIAEFHYYTIEYDDYEDGALLSMLPLSDKKARFTSIWAESDIHNVFDLDYIVTMLCELERNLREDIELYFNINLEGFIKHIPFTIKIGE